MTTYKVSKTDNDEYPYNVQMITDGFYTGNGKFCRSMEEVDVYLKSFGISPKSSKVSMADEMGKGGVL